MLLELSIENFILIDNITITFGKGLNVITGETGAGKSIIIDAVNIVIGEKASKDYIKQGKDKAIIQAVFDISSINLKTILDENGISYEENLLIFSREIHDTGRSLARINGRIVPLSTIKEISKYIIDIHGQHEHQSLLYSENHLNMIDLYGAESIKKILLKVKESYNRIIEIEKELKSLHFDDRERERRIDLLKFQIDEIDSCSLRVGEDEELSKNYKLLKNSKEIYSTVHRVYEMISPSFNNDLTISSIISKLIGEFQNIANLDDKLNLFYNELQDIDYRLQDLGTDLRHYKDEITFDPKLLKEIEIRIDTINNLKRKYGNSIENILNYRDELYRELQEIENSAERVNILKKELNKYKKEYYHYSEILSVERKKFAKKFEKEIIQELNDLNLEKTKFKVNITQNLDIDGNIVISRYGIDKIEFLISTNPGEPLKPLSKVASGGEISRIMLAMKVLLAEIDNIPILIFDEIDTGISGKTANIVGEKLALISDTHQTICVTHLPQIAVMANYHLFIEKTLYKNKTITNIRILNYEERIEEISRLIGGNIITKLTIDNAKELLEIAEKNRLNK